MTTEVHEKSQNAMPPRVYGYEIIDFLGEGAGSVIYATSDPRSGQIYALKHVVVKKEKDVRFIEQLTNEFEISSKVKHPLLRRCIDLKVTKPLLRKPTEAALVMELVQGTSCEASPPTDINTIVDIFQQTATALGALHAQNFVHCDLKPNNILVDSAGHVKVIDLGQACPAGSVKKRIQGTPDFIAPEQVKCEPVSVQTDVYNLGATFYWLLSGSKLPTLFTIKKSQNSFLVADAIPQPHELNPKVPQNLSALVMECVRVTPAKRPSSMADICDRLDIIKKMLQRPTPSA
jgi:eukaryotic-like serine/threonine-protein kinase